MWPRISSGRRSGNVAGLLMVSSLNSVFVLQSSYHGLTKAIDGVELWGTLV